MMRTILLFSLILKALGLFAQVDFHPLLVNPALPAFSNSQQDFLTPPNPCASQPTVFINGSIALVESGKQKDVCFSPDVYNVFKCENCATGLDNGTASLKELCVVYKSNAGQLLAYDTLVISRTDTLKKTSDTLKIIVISKRAGQQINRPVRDVLPEDVVPLCLDYSTSLPGGKIVYGDLLALGEQPGEATRLNDSCFTYTSGRFADTVKVSMVLCDVYCVCDTLNTYFAAIPSVINPPFFDDFSYNQIYPDKRLWLDDQVFINNGLPHNPPSVGAATFDGLNKKGRAHGVGYGRADVLTSAYIDMVPVQTTPYALSFYLQPKGKGYNPNPGDSIIVQFRKSDGTWNTVHKSDGFNGSLATLPPFTYYTVPLDDLNYYHPRFQFRFINYGLREGVIDLWHLDYVRLYPLAESSETGAGDIAFRKLPSPLLRSYTAMPRNQLQGFEEQEITDTFQVALRSFFNVTNQANPNGLRINNLSNGQLLYFSPELLRIDGSVNQVVVNSGEEVNYTNPLKERNNLVSAISGLTGTNAQIRTEYFYNVQSPTQNREEFTRRNDTVRLLTVLQNYFAYDDGSAEIAVSPNQIGFGLAQRYVLRKPDSLRGVQIMFPQYDPKALGTFNLLIYKKLEEAPVYRMDNLRPIYASSYYDTLQGFVTYRLEGADQKPAPLALGAGEFYVAIVQTSNSDNLIKLGYDLNNPSLSKGQQFVFNGVKWSPFNPTIQGTLMYRPVLGDIQIFNTSAKQAAFAQSVAIVPNPANELLRLVQPTEEALRYQLFDLSGQRLLDGYTNHTVHVSGVPDGMYILRWMNAEGLTHTQKIYIQHD